MYEAHIKYRQESQDTKDKAVDMYFYLLEQRLLSDFGRTLVQKNIDNDHRTLAVSCRRVLFTSSSGFRAYNTMLKYQLYLKEFKLYKDKH